MRYIIFLISLSLFLFSCAVKTQIIDNTGKEYIVVGKTDAIVTFESNGSKIIVDNRGRPTLFESIITMMFMDTKLKNEVKEN